MAYDLVESTYEHLRKLGNEHKEAYDSFWVCEQEWNRKLDKLEALVEATVLTKNKIIDEKDQVIKDLGEKLDGADEITRLKDVWRGHADTWKANYEREAKRCKELESKLEDPTREVRDLRLKLAQANAIREGEIEARLALETRIKRLTEQVFQHTESLLDLASRLSK